MAGFVSMPNSPAAKDNRIVSIANGGSIDLAPLGLDFGGQPDLNEEGKPKEAGEAEEIPEVDSSLDEG